MPPKATPVVRSKVPEKKRSSLPPPRPNLLQLYKTSKLQFPVPNPDLPPLPLLQELKLLPQEIQLDVLSHFGYDQLKHVCKSDKYFSNICKDQLLWKKKVQMDFPKKFHWYPVWSDLYQDQDWREFYIFLKHGNVYEPTFTLSNFIYLVVDFGDFGEIPADLSQEQIDELADKSDQHQDMMFCGINSYKLKYTHTKDHADGTRDGSYKTSFQERIQFTMELIKEFPLNGYVFLPYEDLSVGYAFSLINDFQSIYPEVNSGDIVEIKFEPARKILYVRVELHH